jgi:hypothetical protein
MSIEIRCENCGRKLKAPNDAAGKRSKCPSCGHEVYIPTPEDQIDELPLAPEDEEEVAREKRLQEERRRLDRQMARERDDAPSGAGPRAGGSPAGTGQSVESQVLGYLRAMRDADLGRAEQIIERIRPRRAEAIRILDKLTSDQIPPDEMQDVPPGVYQGFLKSLRSQL